MPSRKAMAGQRFLPILLLNFVSLQNMLFGWLVIASCKTGKCTAIWF